MNGTHYFLTIVDHYFKSTWTILLHDKTFVPKVVTDFCVMVQTQFDAQIKVIRTDNETKFLNQACQQLFLSQDIIHQTTCSYTPNKMRGRRLNTNTSYKFPEPLYSKRLSHSHSGKRQFSMQPTL